MLEKYFNGVVQTPTSDYSYLLKEPCEKAAQNLKTRASDFDLKGILEDLWGVVTAANRSVETRQPWKLAKDPSQKVFLGSFLYELLEACRFVGASLAPFMPNASRKVLEMFQESGLPTFQDSAFFGKLKPGTALKKGDPLFPKLEEE
jgi:methionyl-tRNA synthetase